MTQVTETAEQKEARERAEASAAKPKEPRDKGMPDGAKPGDTYEYNADEKAALREGAEITIGEKVWKRVKKSWDVTRELRKNLRTQERHNEKIMRLDAQKDAKAEEIRGLRDDEGNWVKYPLMDEAEIDRIEAEVDKLDEKIDKLELEAEQSAYDTIRLLLHDPSVAVDSDDPDASEKRKPTDEFLKEHLDSAEAAELVRLLTSGRPVDPTPTPPIT